MLVTGAKPSQQEHPALYNLFTTGSVMSNPVIVALKPKKDQQ
ncbi:hypothetical protein [Niabella hirudinis]